MKKETTFKLIRRENGQSLVEVALFFPIFIILLAGLIEVSQIVVAQNRVTNAARVGTRFGANGGDDEGIVNTALNSITQTLSGEESRWDIWTIHATVDDLGTGFEDWEFNHSYGLSQTTRFAQVDEEQVKADVLAELQTGGNPATAGIRIVASLMLHDIDSILGLDALPMVANINAVQDLVVMRVVGLTAEPTIGCSAYPIAIHEGTRSVTPVGEGSNPFPAQRDYSNHSPKPLYDEFTEHLPDIPLEDAKPGYVYKLRRGFGSGNFGWLRWNQGRPDDANTLVGSLTFPGDSTDHETQVSGGSGLPGYGRIKGYIEPGDLSDTALNIGDWVAANTGNVTANAVRDTVNDWINKESTLRVIVWDDSQRQGNYGEYRIKGFAVFRLLGYNLSGDSWILAEFISHDISCGQLPRTGP